MAWRGRDRESKKCPIGGAEEGVLAASPSAREAAASWFARDAEREGGAAQAEDNADGGARSRPKLQLLGAYVARSLRPPAGAWERCLGSADAGQPLHSLPGTGGRGGAATAASGAARAWGSLAVRMGLDAGPEAGRLGLPGLFFLRTRPEPPGPGSLRGSMRCWRGDCRRAAGASGRALLGVR